MSNNQSNSNSGKYYKKSKFRESCKKISSFVIVCNAAGPLTEDFFEEDDILPDD
jgi:hypothetical protein